MKAGNAKRAISIRLDEDSLREVDGLARNLKTTRSNVLEGIIGLFLEQDRLTQNASLTGRKK